jgi:hypothetical protein
VTEKKGRTWEETKNEEELWENEDRWRRKTKKVSKILNTEVLATAHARSYLQLYL